MNYTQLSLDQAPELWTPLRFFISAPIFAIAAVILLLFSGPDVLQHRWLPETLAITHLLTLGFISMIMMGAVFQLLPVLAGSEIYKSKISSKIIHFLMFSGVTLFCTGLAISEPLLIKPGLIFLIPGLLIFLILASLGLYKAKSKFASAVSMRYSVSALWVALLFGSLLAIGTAWDSMPLLRQLTGIHVLWGTLGWVTLMIVAVTYQVVPMFQVTSEYPDIFKRFFSLLMFLCLILLSVQIVADYSKTIMISIVSLAIVAFSAISIKLLLQRKKRLSDASLYFWLTGLSSLVICVFVYNYSYYFEVSLSVFIGFIFFTGFVFSIINGMLFKIVPFLVWLHLNRKLAFTEKGLSGVPTMNEVISRKKMLRQYYCHMAALLLTLLSFYKGAVFFYPAMLAWLLSLGLLFTYLLQSVRLYYVSLKK
ncbi:MAG: hypothetical protein DIZ80_01565 [endosymbiont of Galathealinum brachiosum]|uniref:Uncharacterized protein n=1 Tax=endosymbiont of Galathealinum brachiosum TaxID=2200906 RepID=A0A370DL52_9GAMM|nr:MAG: hypothetical protein DIZ80_01565 [endosymbiont of Galathealinum brachiosum]